MVVLLICLVLVVVAIVVVIRLLLAELARSAAYRHAVTRDPRLDYRYAVNPGAAKAPVSASRSNSRLAANRPGEPPFATPAPYAVDQPAYVEEGGLLVDVAPRPRQREVGRVTKVVWWRRLRSGTALMLLVALLGIATAALVGAIALFFAFVLEQAIN